MQVLPTDSRARIWLCPGTQQCYVFCALQGTRLKSTELRARISLGPRENSRSIGTTPMDGCAAPVCAGELPRASLCPLLRDDGLHGQLERLTNLILCNGCRKAEPCH